MKWWQLLWLLDDNLEFLQEILADPEWASYGEWFRNRESIRIKQRRDILDAYVPDALCLKSLEGCRIRFLVENGQMYGGFPESDTSKLTAVETYTKYGGEDLVDAVDRGVAQIRRLM